MKRLIGLALLLCPFALVVFVGVAFKSLTPLTLALSVLSVTAIAISGAGIANENSEKMSKTVNDGGIVQ